jgi:hypothetical protein
MPMLDPLTELEAVNAMLLSIGQAPVNTLNVSGLTDVSVARDKLSEVTRRVLSRGYSFNTDDNYPLSPDAESVILIPKGALKVKPSGTSKLSVRQHPTKGPSPLERRHADVGLRGTPELPDRLGVLLR